MKKLILLIAMFFVILQLSAALTLNSTILNSTASNITVFINVSSNFSEVNVTSDSIIFTNFLRNNAVYNNSGFSILLNQTNSTFNYTFATNNSAWTILEYLSVHTINTTFLTFNSTERSYSLTNNLITKYTNYNEWEYIAFINVTHNVFSQSDLLLIINFTRLTGLTNARRTYDNVSWDGVQTGSIRSEDINGNLTLFFTIDNLLTQGEHNVSLKYYILADGSSSGPGSGSAPSVTTQVTTYVIDEIEIFSFDNSIKNGDTSLFYVSVSNTANAPVVVDSLVANIYKDSVLIEMIDLKVYDSTIYIFNNTLLVSNEEDLGEWLMEIVATKNGIVIKEEKIFYIYKTFSTVDIRVTWEDLKENIMMEQVQQITGAIIENFKTNNYVRYGFAGVIVILLVGLSVYVWRESTKISKD